MGFWSTIIFGLVIGVLAKLVLPGRNDMRGFVNTALVGVIGAFIASYAGQLLGFYADGEGAGWLASIAGAVAALMAFAAITKKNAA